VSLRRFQNRNLLEMDHFRRHGVEDQSRCPFAAQANNSAQPVAGLVPRPLLDYAEFMADRECGEYAWDPNQIGPVDCCIRCFTPRSEDTGYAFCLTCGRQGSLFAVPDVAPSDARCSLHRESPAIGYCCLCGRCICESCTQMIGTSLTTLVPATLKYCVSCRQREAEIQAGFFSELKSSGACGKHRTTKADSVCVKCSLPLCRACAYFKVKGILRRTIGEGPYCLACFRSETLHGGRNLWASGDGSVHSTVR